MEQQQHGGSNGRRNDGSCDCVDGRHEHDHLYDHGRVQWHPKCIAVTDSRSECECSLSIRDHTIVYRGDSDLYGEHGSVKPGHGIVEFEQYCGSDGRRNDGSCDSLDGRYKHDHLYDHRRLQCNAGCIAVING